MRTHAGAPGEFAPGKAFGTREQSDPECGTCDKTWLQMSVSRKTKCAGETVLEEKTTACPCVVLDLVLCGVEVGEQLL